MTTEDIAGPASLTPEQIKTLLAPINGSRVSHTQGNAYLEAWDVRRWLNRTFGFGGWSLTTLELAVVSEREINPGRWTVVYRAQARLTVKTTDGRVISHWDDGATGDGINQKSLGDAHDMASKTALSQALKRCAVNLGDQFGMSLYNDGSTSAVVVWSAAHAPRRDDTPEDEPVKPERQNEQPEPERHLRQVPAGKPDQRATSETAPDFVAEAKQCTDADCAVQVFRKAQAAGADATVLEEIKAIGRKLRKVEQPPMPEPEFVDAASRAVSDVQLPVDDHEAAVAAFRAFTAEHGISDTDADQQAYAALGAPLADVAPQAIWDLLSQLTAAA